MNGFSKWRRTERGGIERSIVITIPPPPACPYCGSTQVTRQSTHGRTRYYRCRAEACRRRFKGVVTRSSPTN